ncbi:MAG TPA: TonB-dependent receptor [Thermoanaerobaculia bacterium]
MSWLACVLLATAPVLRQEIVVTAERSAVPRSELTTATTILTRKEVEALPASNAAQVLTLVPGVTMFGAGSTIPATLTMRGFYGGGEADYARLLVDGVPLADAESNVAPWQQLHAEEIERVEVVRGLASPVYGDAAFGGIVQVFTRQRAPGEWTATLTGGSHGTAEASGGAWLRAFGGELSVLADWRESDGDRPRSESAQRGARLRWRREGLALSGSLRSHERNDPGPLPLEQLDERVALVTGDYDDHTRAQLAASFDATRWRASLHATSKRGDATRTFLFLDTASRTLDSGELGGSFQLHGDRWHGGVDLARQRIDAEWLGLAHTDAHRNVAAAHATARVPLTPSVMLVGGARVDHVGESVLSPRLGLSMQRGGATMYLSAAHGFTAPTLEQLYDSRPIRLFGASFTLSNPELKPQRARGVEAGFTWRMLSVDAYWSRVRDEIDFDAGTFRYQNLARSEHRGVELLLESRFARVTYAWTRVTDGSAQLKNIPLHSGTVVVPLRYATLLYAWNTGRFFDDAERIAAPDTHALSLRAQHRFRRLHVFVDVLNVFDRHHAALGYALEGAGYAYPDQRRAIRLGVRRP